MKPENESDILVNKDGGISAFENLINNGD